MNSVTVKLFLRILFIPLTGIFVFRLFSLFVGSLNSVIYHLTDKTDYHIFLRYDTRNFVILWLTAFWLVSLFLLEVFAAFRPDFRFRRLLVNLRYAPFLILLCSTIVVALFDLGMIEYSKWKIRDYLYRDSTIIDKPEIQLHNDYRHWCGNGYSAQENYLYFETAAAGFDSENPSVRSRSLLMAAEVRDWLNGGDTRFDDFLVESCADSDGIVRATAENFLNESDSSCQKYLSGK